MPQRIMVPLYTFPDGVTDGMVRHAVTLAEHLHASIECRVFQPELPRIVNPLGNLLLDIPALAGEIRAKCRERAMTLVDALHAEAGKQGISANVEWTSSGAVIADGVAAEARYHDLVLCDVGAGDAEGHMIAEAAIFGSGRPVLLVSGKMSPPDGYDHLAIAWDGSRAAARAFADARPFLASARRVTVLTAFDDKPLVRENPGQRLADILCAEGKDARALQVECKDQPIAEVLQQHAVASGADLMVMGAFGHSRLRDFVLGGATTGVIENPGLTVLLSH